MSVVSCKVVTSEKVASNVVRLQISRPDGFVWKTGEFARIGLTVGAEQVFRAYSIASTPDSATVDFYIANVKGGQLSPRLNALKAGDTVLLDSEVNGMLLADRLEPNGKDLWLFASGTGVAPFMAVIADEGICSQYENIILVHGVRTWAETGYIARFVRNSPKLRVISSVTREPGAIVNMRIPEALECGLIQKTLGIEFSKERSRVMLCGNPAMVKGVREYMKKLDIVSPRRGNPGQLLAENFWL